MEENELLQHFERLLEDVAPRAILRQIEAGGSTSAIWAHIHESGFLDALVPEAKGGAGLMLADVEPLLQACGRHLVPLPVAETMVARALLAEADIDRPDGPIMLAIPSSDGEDYRQFAAPLAAVSEFALVDLGDRLVLSTLSGAQVRPTGVHGCLSGDILWSSMPSGPVFAGPAQGLRPTAALIAATAIAGAAGELLQMTTEYAGSRVQFGKPIGKQQVIQQQLAVMAEQVVMARIAAQIGCSQGFPPPSAHAAVAKQVASAAVSQVVPIAHAIHGAIGMSEEFDLQLYARKLGEWRLAHGSEGYWAEVLGRQRISAPVGTSVDFLRARVALPTLP